MLIWIITIGAIDRHSRTARPGSNPNNIKWFSAIVTTSKTIALVIQGKVWRWRDFFVITYPLNAGDYLTASRSKIDIAICLTGLHRKCAFAPLIQSV